MQNLFKQQEITHSLINGRTWEIPQVRTECYGIESIRYRGPITWESLPNDIKGTKSPPGFKTKIRKYILQTLVLFINSFFLLYNFLTRTVMFGGHHISLFTILPVVAQLVVLGQLRYLGWGSVCGG